VIINDAFVKQYWKDGGDPLGQQLFIGKGFGEFEDTSRQVVGIVSDVRDNGLNNNPPPTMYVPLAQLSDHFTAAASVGGAD
jgi:hypothetical protein